jgi:hypothetical protein
MSKSPHERRTMMENLIAGKTNILFPGSPNKIVSRQDLDEIFGKQYQKKRQIGQILQKKDTNKLQQQRQQLQKLQQFLYSSKPSTSSQNKRKRSITDSSSSSATRSSKFPQKSAGVSQADRSTQLKKVHINVLKDRCKSRYNIDCEKIKKKDDIISIILRKEYVK